MDNVFTTGIPGFSLRLARPEDSALILQFIMELADYEHLGGQVVATEDSIRTSIFEKKQADVLIGEAEGEAVAFAVVYYPYSTFIGGVYLYLEDLFVRPAHRNKGLGKAIFRCLAELAVRQGITRMEWWCLDWNTNSIEFYKKLGAVPQNQFTTFRLDGQALEALAR